MAITLNGTTGITSTGGYTGDGIVLADGTPSNTLVTTTGGLVGIGTGSPAVRLDVAGGSIRVDSGTGGLYATFNSTNANGGYATFLSSGTVHGDIGTASQIVSGGSTSDFGINARGSRNLIFGAANLERARIDSSGNLLVGTTSIPTTANGLGIYSFGTIVTGRSTTSTAGHHEFRNPNGLVGQIVTDGSSTSYLTSSDYRLKENVAPMTGALAKVAALKPCTYTWKADGSAGQGFIAHELQEVVPDCVTGTKDAVDKDGKPQYQGVDTSFLVATLVKAIQELKAEVDALKGAA